MSSPLRMNLRTRLTILYASLLAVGLLLYAGGVSVLFLHNLREQLDSSLDRDVETVEGALTAGPGGVPQISEREREADESKLDPGYLLEVWSTDGKLLYRREQLRSQDRGFVSGGNPASGSESVHSVRLPSGMRLRSVSRVHHLDNGGAVVVRLAISEEPLWRELAEAAKAKNAKALVNAAKKAQDVDRALAARRTQRKTR